MIDDDRYGDSIAHVGRNMAACRTLGVKFGPGYATTAFTNIDKVWTMVLAGDHRLRWIGSAPEPDPPRSCQHDIRSASGKRLWCKSCEGPDRARHFTP